MAFNPNSRHNMAAPGFSQSYDPFADLSRNTADIDEALDFEETYDGLGDQLDETDDAFNDDTFGGGGSGITSHAPVGKDFDFFGQTAKVANAMEEEHQRFSRQQPVPKSTYAAPTQNYSSGYTHQPEPKPVRSGYEKYKAEPVSDLQVDASIWGVQPKKTPAATAATHGQQVPSPAPPGGRKMMSLEEVEAAMRAQSKAPQSQQPQLLPQLPAKTSPESQMSLQHAHYPRQEPADYPQQQFNNRQPQGYYPTDSHQAPQGPAHGHPISILQRPSSKHAPSGTPGIPSPLPQQHQQPQQPQASPMGFPMQILQNPNRMSGDAARMAAPAHPTHRSQSSFSGPPQGANPQLSEQEKLAYLEAEARRAKRNHKIHALSRDNGLMTPQDKSFITRIQLQQLVSATGDPSEHGTDAALAEDFYYQVLSSLRVGQRPNPHQPLNNFAQTYLFQTGTRHGGMRRQGRGPENHMQRMEQQVQRAVEAAKNKPKNKQLVIEGSLGKISFSNAKTPKPLLNVKRTDSSSDANRPGSGHRSHPTANGTDEKETLRCIESVYLTLMKMEDVSRNMPPPPPSGEPDQGFVDRQAELEILNGQLWNDLKVHEPIGATSLHPFIAFLSYNKGKKAIPRVFRHLTPEQRTTILTLIVIHLDQLDVIRGAQVQTGETITLDAKARERIDIFSVAVMPSLLQLLSESELHIVTGVLGLITQNINVDTVARTRVGMSMLTMVLTRAEILKQAGQASDQSWQQW